MHVVTELCTIIYFKLCQVPIDLVRQWPNKHNFFFFIYYNMCVCMGLN